MRNSPINSQSILGKFTFVIYFSALRRWTCSAVFISSLIQNAHEWRRRWFLQDTWIIFYSGFTSVDTVSFVKLSINLWYFSVVFIQHPKPNILFQLSQTWDAVADENKRDNTTHTSTHTGCKWRDCHLQWTASPPPKTARKKNNPPPNKLLLPVSYY